MFCSYARPLRKCGCDKVGWGVQKVHFKTVKISAVKQVYQGGGVLKFLGSLICK